MSTPTSAVERPEPPFLAAEREGLDTWLEFRRATRSGATGDWPAPRRGALAPFAEVHDHEPGLRSFVRLR